ncbi:MAG: dihydroxyacetone kinase subunit DhaK [Planctomycetota bacterium]|jgi:dihydroxyacetone kinase-like protein|nr:dihydroxyacetone kinase subunit DhaK [Planctomycetota bacterium]
MKKFINAPESYVDEMLDGILAAHPARLRHAANDKRCIVRKQDGAAKVRLVTGGGSGHLPLFLGYVGSGMLDGCAVGGVFQSPSAEQWYQTAKAYDLSKGVLFIYGNYTGDIMNYEMAKEMLDMDGVRVDEVRGFDDVASAPKGEEHKRRGVAGIFFMYKCAGAKAEQGADFDEVKRIAEKVGNNVRTMGVALSPCTIPEVGKPSFSIGDGEMEIGMGIHGEPGIRRGKLLPANDVIDEMMKPILADLSVTGGDEVAVLVNGLGGTPLDELYILYSRIHNNLNAAGAKVFHVYAGEYATAMEMTGFSLSVLKLDDELKGLLAAPARTPFFEQGQL